MITNIVKKIATFFLFIAIQAYALETICDRIIEEYNVVDKMNRLIVSKMRLILIS
ncbi:hypothetical protein GCM10011351_13220 [Paraliobacillus quinghaiensis]|uniref:Uncharacterized protein n=1 Tax=Paraliobacillus quinghaiensis TaxID=470815 RepID=A0A917WU12_9BACI|nr:hypothetical protein GCM10011351_13220 [Paraliobacillus quinghaiensis]